MKMDITLQVTNKLDINFQLVIGDLPHIQQYFSYTITV